MNKVIITFIMAFTAVLCSCSEPEAAPAQAIISAADVTVEEGQTAQIPAALIRVETCDTWKAMPRISTWDALPLIHHSSFFIHNS